MNTTNEFSSRTLNADFSSIDFCAHILNNFEEH